METQTQRKGASMNICVKMYGICKVKDKFYIVGGETVSMQGNTKEVKTV
jgi:hypothetical protein